MASILVVDDEPTMRELLALTVGEEHRVEQAADGAEALRRLFDGHPDIVLLDVAMPMVDGLDVCRAARAEPSLAGLGIIVLSAYAGREAALAAGADRHQLKPFSPLELLENIEQLLARPQVRCRADGTSTSPIDRAARNGADV
jgi:CheY-like chemotaxis protein